MTPSTTYRLVFTSKELDLSQLELADLIGLMTYLETLESAYQTQTRSGFEHFATSGRALLAQTKPLLALVRAERKAKSLGLTK